MRGTIGTLLAAILLTLSIGLQVLEATGRWDRTIEDTGDEAAILTVVLCIGAALVVAVATRPRHSLTANATPVVIRPAARFDLIASPAPSLAQASPPISLRI